MKERKKSRTAVKTIAYFWRYGYWALMLFTLFILKNTVNSETASMLCFGIYASVFGMYTLVAIKFNFQHIFCEMQNSNHQKMTPHAKFTKKKTKKMRREMTVISIIFLVLGLLCIFFAFNPSI